jgi:hypothetical protein
MALVDDVEHDGPGANVERHIVTQRPTCTCRNGASEPTLHDVSVRYVGVRQPLRNHLRVTPESASLTAGIPLSVPCILG